MLHRLVTEVSGVRIEQHNLPLDNACNKYVDVQVHPNSCIMARYAIAARNQGKFWDMNELLFENKPETEESILNLSRKLNLDIPKLYEDANSKEIKDKLNDEIEYSDHQEIIGTPTLIINMTKHTGLLPYYDLKDQVIKLGAIERK